MKTICKTIFWLFMLLPAYSLAQHVTEYRPAGGLLVSSAVNLESLRGTNAVVDAAPGNTRSLNTLQEAAGAAPSDFWFVTSNPAGVVLNSLRYGVVGNDERAAAMELCINGDYILIGTANVGGLDRIMAVRITPAGAIVWSMIYSAPNSYARSYCIKRTNDAAVESYIIAGTLGTAAAPDKTLLALKINAANGAIMWNSIYFDPVVPNNIFDQPRSMVVVNGVHYIAGNRRNDNAQDIFTIAIGQAAGGIAVNYAYLDNNNQVDLNPYINITPGGGFVLAYSTVAAIAGVNTSRVAFTRLNGGLAPLAATTMYWEANTTNNYGHTIYPNAAGGYDIGGGANLGVAAALRNPTFFSIAAAGGIIAGSYRRLWPPQDFISTFMLQDPATAGMANFTAHHNYRAAANPNGMSVMRNAAACFVNPQLQAQNVANVQVVRNYNRNAPLVLQQYPLANPVVAGQFFTCAGGAGNFKLAPKPGTVDEPATGGTFKVYPNFISNGQSQLTVEAEAMQDAPAIITIYNMQMQPLKQFKKNLHKGNNRIGLDVGALPRGTFMVELKTGDQLQKTRIIRQ